MAAEKILVVDGDAGAQALTLTSLRRAGYQATATLVGQGLLDQVSASDCDVIVADFSSSAEPAVPFLKAMKAQYPSISVIVLTADRDTDAIIATMGQGVFDYILKPLERDRLLNAVSRAAAATAAAKEQMNYSHGLEQLVEARTHMLRQAVTDLERSYDITLEALGDALDLKDAETEGHSKRVTAYTIALARAMGVHGIELRIMARGAFLHDIGKMAIPDAILLKPGKLNDDERSVMREHCLRGYLIVRKIPYLKDAAEIVYSHQEHFDGSGYPRNLRGSEIPLGARIFAIADTLDAITSDRPYRQGRSFVHACSEIERCGGTQFDPAVVNTFLKMPVQIWEELRIEILHRSHFHTVPVPPTLLNPQAASPLTQ